MVVPEQRAGSHALLTRAPLGSSSENKYLVRLACVRRAASVRSEPGSNSQFRQAIHHHQSTAAPAPTNRSRSRSETTTSSHDQTSPLGAEKRASPDAQANSKRRRLHIPSIKQTTMRKNERAAFRRHETAAARKRYRVGWWGIATPLWRCKKFFAADRGCRTVTSASTAGPR